MVSKIFQPTIWKEQIFKATLISYIFTTKVLAGTVDNRNWIKIAKISDNKQPWAGYSLWFKSKF